MQVNRGRDTNTTRGNRKTIYCEGKEESADILFYTTLLGMDRSKFEFKAMGSCNTLLCYAQEDHLISTNDFCLIDRDFRTDDEVESLESRYKIKFLPTHEIENLLLNPKYLEKLSYLKKNINIAEIEIQINKIIEEKRVRFLADFLQFKINTHLDRFPRIKQLRKNELPNEDELIHTILAQLDSNYEEVESKISEIKNTYINDWKVEYDRLTLRYLPAKEIFRALKDKIFINFPQESDIVKDIARLMEADSFMPSELIEIFN